MAEPRELEQALLAANARAADLAKQLTEATETQKKFLAAELHDDVLQILVGLRMRMTPSTTPTGEWVSAASVAGWMELVQLAIDHLHELAVALRKPSIDGRELPGAMRTYVAGLPLAPHQKIVLEADPKVGTLAPNVALACFRIVQEGLANAVKHSGARNLRVRLKRAADRLIVSVRDDGVGFDVEDVRLHASDGRNIGLCSMGERAAAAGGRFEITSLIGHGTRIRASFPIRSANRKSH